MIIAATADVHAPRFYDDFVRAVDSLTVNPDLLLLAGDMVERAHPREYEKVYNALFGKFNCPIIACFGNNEFIPDIREELKSLVNEIKFLDDSAVAVRIGDVEVGIVGSMGSLDVPTKWQKTNIPNIENVYRQRMDIVDRALQRMETHVKIILMHYAPTYKTLVGENVRVYGGLGSHVFENVLLQRKPNLVVHGHSHKGSPFAWVDSVPVFNVAFPVNKDIVVIDTEKIKPGLAKFV